jgi:hypothetical protein
VVQLQGRPLPTRLRLDKGFQPCPVETGDEMYPNGIFEFNITRLLAFVQGHADRFHVEQVDLFVCGVLERQGQDLTRRSSWAEQVV